MHLPFSNRRPSPALVLAFVALLVALSGTAVALPGKNSVDSGDLKRNSVKNPDIARGAVTRAKIRNNAINGAKVDESSLGQVPSASTAANLDGSPPSSYRARWAQVNADGTIAAQSGGITVVRNFPGEYYVNFGSSQAGKALSATPKWTAATRRFISVALCGGGPVGIDCVAAGTNNTNHVYVDLKNEAGTNTDHPFYVHIPASN